MIDIKRIELDETCSESPEQYDAWYDGEKVGYLRMRHGEFRVDFPDCGDETIYYSQKVIGDGKFDPNERNHFLTEARKAIARKLEAKEEG